MYNEAVHVSMYNQAVPNLPCSPNAQSSMQLSCFQCTQYTFTDVEHLHELEASCKNHPSPVLSPSLSNTSMKLGALAQTPEKEKDRRNLQLAHVQK